MGLVVVPVVKGKEEEWKSWAKKLKSDMKNDFNDMNKRHGLTRHDVWAVETPNGLMAAVLHEGPGADTFMHDIAVSDNPVDIEMRKKIESFHGMDLSAPPPGPMPVKLV
ncbi:MAG TPA: hypothetical protein VKA38_01510 [Draconibacterium sp.]|nr:hypothetical protein [Draconibacterium sp.]